MRLKIIMDSGKEYEISLDRTAISSFTDSFYNDMGGRGRIMKNSFIFLDEEEKILFNPSHVSSVELIED
ncbi:hypothetical protein [Oceanobacillus oncorhynchi]|uniref:hypothetical protein n=1 Tax=Oceanobacillus oncorhynchi TaxID=545501 RepID=UPI001866C257|nr:hypothetical protein [Oceanobacillus oncorhynchi]